MVDTQRFWDGRSWTNSIAPTNAPASALHTEPGKPRDDNTFAWTVALLPVLLLPLDYFAPQASAVSWPLVVIVTVVLVTLDTKRLERRGIHSGAGWALLVPVYLILRTIRAKSTPAIPIVWFAAFGLSILGAFTFAAAYEFDESFAETSISQWLKENGSGGGISVDCPDTGYVRAGDSVRCSASDGAGSSLDVEVTVEQDGYYSWQALP